MEVNIRPEQLADRAVIRQINEEAFGRANEADLVDALRGAEAVSASLVADVDGVVAGHILFSPVTVDGPTGRFPAVGLAPLAVRPAYQRRGLGGQLIRAGLEACRQAGHELVFVLGHADYYPRFGFRPAQPLGLRWEVAVPVEVFLVAELRPGALAGRSGVLKYHPAFAGV